MESASADDVRARGSPKGLVLAPLQAQAQHYPKGEGWKRSQFGSRKRSQTDRQTDAPTTTTLIASGPPLRGDPYFVCISTTLLRNNPTYPMYMYTRPFPNLPAKSRYFAQLFCSVISDILLSFCHLFDILLEFCSSNQSLLEQATSWFRKSHLLWSKKMLTLK